MQHMVLLAAMALASVDVRADTCVLHSPLKAIRSQGTQWKSLRAGTELTVIERKEDWTRVQHGETIHLVSTRQFDAACKPGAAAPAAPAAPAAQAPAAQAPAAQAPAAQAAAPQSGASTPADTGAGLAPNASAGVPALSPSAGAQAPGSSGQKGPERETIIAGAAPAEPTGDTALPPKLSLATMPTMSSAQLLILAVLVVGAAVGILLLRRRTLSEQQLLDVVATRVIGRGKQLIVVDTGEARLLLGVTNQTINVLSSSPSHPDTRGHSPRGGAHHSAGHHPYTNGMADGLLKSVGSKVAGLWGRAPSGPPADWDNFDRILASATPEHDPTTAAPDMRASQSRRPTERTSPTSSADLTELTRELQRHGTRRTV